MTGVINNINCVLFKKKASVILGETHARMKDKRKGGPSSGKLPAKRQNLNVILFYLNRINSVIF